MPPKYMSCPIMLTVGERQGVLAVGNTIENGKKRVTWYPKPLALSPPARNGEIRQVIF